MSVNKAAAAVVGLTFFGLLMLGLLWSVFGGIAKTYLPGELGYSRLGWAHAGHQTVWFIGVPKWAGWQGFLAAAQAPFRHHKIYLRQGQKIVADYDINIERGEMELAVYRTNLSVIFQGVLVEDSKYIRFHRPGRHIGTFEYVAPQDGIYRFKRQIWWDRDANRGNVVPLPNYEMVYDIRWRLERN